MRKLTIKRKWSFIECASKISLLVECEKTEATDYKNDAPYKRIPLKNGKTLTVDIPSETTKVFVVSKTMQIGYVIPPTEDNGDVSLITEPHYDPMRGNPFTINQA